MLGRFWKDKSGATAIEYGLIVAILSLAIVGGVSHFANSLDNLWGNTSRLMDTIK